MTRIKYDNALMQSMLLFERVTGAKLKDCISRDSELIFIVEPLQMGKALGKEAHNLHRLRELLKRKIKIVEFDPEVTQFARSLIYPLQVKAIHLDGDVLVIEGTDMENRAHLIGKGRQNLLQHEEIVKRHFPIRQIRVI